MGILKEEKFLAKAISLSLKNFQQHRPANLIPVLCVGETQAQREAGSTAETVLGQLNTVLGHVGIEAFKQAVIAYEPVWAIGTGLTASPEQAQEVHALIRKTISELDQGVGEQVRIIYGGSVKGANAATLFAQPDIDGALVGGASLVAEEFIRICASFE